MICYIVFSSIFNFFHKHIKRSDKVIEYIQSQGLKTVVSPFETTIEGDYDKLMEIVKQCQYVACEAGAPGLMTYVKINFNPGPDGILTISDKIDKYTKKDGE